MSGSTTASGLPRRREGSSVRTLWASQGHVKDRRWLLMGAVRPAVAAAELLRRWLIGAAIGRSATAVVKPS